MSVLAAAVDWSRRGQSQNHLAAMLGRAAAWSPDGVLVRGTASAALGVGRLVTTAQQAHDDRASADTAVVAVVDARFDELSGLRRALDAAPDASDNDLVVAGYRRWGPDVVKRLRGEFALLIWDEGTATLVAARDPFGIRPLFYARGHERVLVASDPEQILATGLVSTEPDHHAVVGHLLWNFSDAEKSFFREIGRLPAGHVLVATAGDFRISDYRTLDLSEVRLRDAREYFEEYRRLFFAAITRRLESTGRPLLQLSGGLDSSAIVCAADRIQRDDAAAVGPLVVSALYPGLRSNEEGYMRAVAGRIGLSIECWDGTAAAPDELADVPIWGPVGRFVWTGGTNGDLRIARAHGSRVIISGTGGDQLGASSGAHQDAVVEGRWWDAARFGFEAPGATLRSSVRTYLSVAKSLSPSWARDFHERLRHRPEGRPSWLRERAWRDWRPRATSARLPPSLRGHLKRQRWASLTDPRHVYSIELVQHLATREQVEYRFPFMDADLIAFTLAIPARLWPPPWPYERLHRGALADLLPPAVQQRRGKANASDALAKRVTCQLPTIRRIVTSGTWFSEPYVDRASAAVVVDRFERARSDDFWASWAVWGIVTLEAWLRALSSYTAAPIVEACADGRFAK